MQEKIIDYEILSHNTPESLVDSVKEYIKMGWHPLGAPFPLSKKMRFSDKAIEHFAQAMVKYADAADTTNR